LLAGIHGPSLLVAQPLIVLRDPERPATNDVFAAVAQKLLEKRFADPVQRPNG